MSALDWLTDKVMALLAFCIGLTLTQRDPWGNPSSLERAMHDEEHRDMLIELEKLKAVQQTMKDLER